jgi:predicted nucleic acid-binding protein
MKIWQDLFAILDCTYYMDSLLPIIDGLLAATAKVHDLTLVTRNIKDVERTSIRLLNPFEPHHAP